MHPTISRLQALKLITVKDSAYYIKSRSEKWAIFISRRCLLNAIKQHWQTSVTVTVSWKVWKGKNYISETRFNIHFCICKQIWFLSGSGFCKHIVGRLSTIHLSSLISHSLMSSIIVQLVSVSLWSIEVCIWDLNVCWLNQNWNLFARGTYLFFYADFISTSLT